MQPNPADTYQANVRTFLEEHPTEIFRFIEIPRRFGATTLSSELAAGYSEQGEHTLVLVTSNRAQQNFPQYEHVDVATDWGNSTKYRHVIVDCADQYAEASFVLKTWVPLAQVQPIDFVFFLNGPAPEWAATQKGFFVIKKYHF